MSLHDCMTLHDTCMLQLPVRWPGLHLAMDVRAGGGLPLRHLGPRVLLLLRPEQRHARQVDVQIQPEISLTRKSIN